MLQTRRRVGKNGNLREIRREGMKLYLRFQQVKKNIDYNIRVEERKEGGKVIWFVY